MRPTAGSEAREFTSRAERGRVPPLFNKIHLTYFVARFGGIRENAWESDPIAFSVSK